MSLIQEALKRQQMEQEGKVPPPGGTAKDSSPLKSTVVDGETFILPGTLPAPAEIDAPQAPVKPTLKRNAATAVPPRTEAAVGHAAPEPPVAAAARAPEPDPDRKRVASTPAAEAGGDKKTTRVLPALASVIILLLLLAGALVWAVTYGLELAGIRLPWSTDETAVIDQSVASVPSVETDDTKGPTGVNVAETPGPKPTDAKADAGEPAKKPTIGSVVRQTVKDANAFVQESDVVIAGAAGETDAVAASPAKASPVTEPPVADTHAMTDPSATVVATPPETSTPPAPVMWPAITISGVVGKAQKGAVFVNGKVVGVNETIEGVRVLAIKPQGALLEYQGETRLAKVGQPVNRPTR